MECVSTLPDPQLKPWFKKVVYPHIECESGQTKAIIRLVDILKDCPWGVLIGLTGSGKSYIALRAVQEIGTQALTITAANALEHHKNLNKDYINEDSEENFSRVISYDKISFNNQSSTKGNLSNRYILRQGGRYYPTRHFKQMAKKFGVTLIIDEIQKTKNTINYSEALRCLVYYVVYRLSKANQYKEDDTSKKAVRARNKSHSRVIYASFCPFDSYKQLKTFCWLSAILEEEPEGNLSAKKFKAEIQELIELAKMFNPKKTNKMVKYIPESINERDRLIANLSLIIWKEISVETPGITIKYKCDYYDMFYEVPRSIRRDTIRALEKVDRMNHGKGGKSAKLISELKFIEEKMIDAGIPQTLALDALENNKRVILATNYNDRFSELKKEFTDKNYRIGVIKGDVTSKRRETVAGKFRWGELDIVFMNKDSGAEGISLQNLANDGVDTRLIYFADHKFQKGVQMSNRSIRLGMTSNVEVICLYPWVSDADIPTLISVYKSMLKKLKEALPFMAKDLGVIKLPGQYTAVDKNFEKMHLDF